MANKKKPIDENVECFLREGVLPNGMKPIVMSNVEEYLRGQGDLTTNEFMEIINRYR